MSSEVTERKRLRRQFDWSNTAPSVAIVESIAAFEERRENWVDAIDRPLDEYVDTDALDALVANGRPCSVSLVVSEYRVRIDDDTVSVAYDDGADI